MYRGTKLNKIQFNGLCGMITSTKTHNGDGNGNFHDLQNIYTYQNTSFGPYSIYLHNNIMFVDCKSNDFPETKFPLLEKSL